MIEARVWAPAAESVVVRSGGRDQPLNAEGEGVWAGEVEADPGDDYRFVLDGGEAWPDPVSRWQPQVVRGPSRVIDTSTLEIGPGPELALEDIVFYELHAGTVPDPQNPQSFERSKLTPGEPEQLYRELLRLRRELPGELEVQADEEARVLTLRRGRATLRADFANETVELEA